MVLALLRDRDRRRALWCLAVWATFASTEIEGAEAIVGLLGAAAPPHAAGGLVWANLLRDDPMEF